MTLITSGQKKGFRRLIEDALDKACLDKEAMQRLLEKGDEFQLDIAASIAKHAIRFSTWKTIKLGTNGLKTADDFRKAIKGCGMKIGDYANDILGKPAFSVATEETEIDIVVISVAELGFKNGARREDIYARAKELGLECCSPEVGPQLRLQYEDQPSGEWLIIAMEPITGSDGSLRLFGVRRDDDDLWLSSNYGGPGGFWDSGGHFVFSRRK